MSAAENRNLSLNIGGRNHVISVAPGEEAHLRHLAGMIDARTSGVASGQTEARMLLIAALMLADELDALRDAPPAPATTEAPPAPELHERVARLADRVEKLAARLEQSGEGA